MNLDNILNKLTKVKRTGNDQFMACCPAHDDRTPSLAIKDAGDGKIIFNCLAGCAKENILGALGLGWEDIMPPKQPVQHSYKPTQQKIYATDALKAIQLEARIVMLAAFDLAKGMKASETDLERLKVAMERINTAVGMI